MTNPITYSLSRATGTINLALTDERLICQTQGTGLLDKPKSIDMPLADLKQFCLVPTIGLQNLKTITNEGDNSYDSEFIFSYVVNGKLNKKRVFVNSQDENFRNFSGNFSMSGIRNHYVHCENHCQSTRVKQVKDYESDE